MRTRRPEIAAATPSHRGSRNELARLQMAAPPRHQRFWKQVPQKHIFEKSLELLSQSQLVIIDCGSYRPVGNLPTRRSPTRSERINWASQDSTQAIRSCSGRQRIETWLLLLVQIK